MVIQFKNRVRELKEISHILNSSKFELVILYGRRRVGKTELILKASENKKRIYYLAIGEKNLDRFYDTCSKEFPEITKLKKDWEVLFDFLGKKAETVIIDEFQNIIKEDANILNLLQSIVDTNIKNSKSKLFLVGSSVSIITSKVLDYKSPLYGRRTGSIDLKPVLFSDLPKFFKKRPIEELVEIYGFSDGIPFYLVKIDKGFWVWLKEEIISERSFLKDEVDFLMKYEFEDSSTYKLILEAISHGKNTVNEIKDFIQLKRTDISPYLRNLIEVKMVKREVPITENMKSRKGRYYLADNFLKFWFRYIYPNLSLIESGSFDINTIKKAYNSYLGFVFEDIILQLLLRKSISLIDFTKIGRWWYRDKEIDIIALNEERKEILFVECKWQDKVNSEEIVRELIEKSKNVQWVNKIRKESFAVFAKSFNKKIDIFENKKVYCYDLKDIEKRLKKG